MSWVRVPSPTPSFPKDPAGRAARGIFCIWEYALELQSRKKAEAFDSSFAPKNFRSGSLSPTQSGLLEEFKQLAHMRFGFDAAQGMNDFALRINDKCGALNSETLAAVHRFFFEYAIKVADGFFLVGEQRKVEVLLVAERAMALYAVSRDAEHLIAQSLEVGEMVTEPLSFSRAARRIVFRIEIEHDAVAAQGRERNRRTGVALERKVRCFHAGSKFCHHLVSLK